MTVPPVLLPVNVGLPRNVAARPGADILLDM